MNKTEKVAIAATVAFVVAVLLIYLLENENEKKKQREKAKKLEGDPSITAKIKEQLAELTNDLRLNPEIVEELRRTLLLVEIGQMSSAIRSLSKIMENLISARYAHSSDYNDWLTQKEKGKGKQNSYYYMLEYALSINELCKEEVSFFRGVKEIRNRESHELAVNIGYLEAPALLIGVGGIVKVANLPPLIEKKNL